MNNTDLDDLLENNKEIYPLNRNYHFKFESSKSYKGCISYIKIKEGNNFWIRKHRPFKTKDYKVSRQDYYWCNTYDKAAKLWSYCHTIGTASDDNTFPLTKKLYENETEKSRIC